MRRVLIALIALALLLIGFILYRSRSTNQLDVDPEAAREIEKAKRR